MFQETAPYIDSHQQGFDPTWIPRATRSDRPCVFCAVDRHGSDLKMVRCGSEVQKHRDSRGFSRNLEKCDVKALLTHRI